MEMHQIRYFLAVCESLNFTRAAEHCHVAQPSLTRAIKKLEAELGGPLFRRERARTHLTDLGRSMRPYFQQVYDACAAASSEAAALSSLERAPLRLGVMSTIAPLRLVGFLSRLRREVPSLELSPREARGTDLVEALLQGDLDIALIGLPALPEPLVARPLYEERYAVGFRQGHRFEALATVPVAELDGEDYLLRAHCEFSDYYKAMGEPVPFEVSLRHTTDREEWAQALILAGLGCSIMPEFMPMLPGVATRILVEPEVTRTVSLVTVAGRRHSPGIEAFVRLALRYDWRSVERAEA